MICFSVTLLKVLPETSENLVKNLRRGGVLATLAQQLKGHIGCSILESDITTDLYLVIRYWQSKYDYFESEMSPIGIFLADVLDRLAYHHSTLGPFTFPPPETLVTEALLSEAMIDAASAESLAEVDSAELVRN
jgi:hypothetical protein